MSIVSNRARLYDVGKSSGSNQTATYRGSYWATQQGPITGLRLVYPHVFLNSTGEEDGEAENLLIKAAIEYNGAFQRVFFHGRRIAEYEPGSILVSDPVGLRIPAGANFFVRSRISVNTVGHKWPTMTATNTTIGEGYSSNAADQADDYGVLDNNAGAALFGPAAILGEVQSTEPVYSVVIIGSSSGAGQGDAAEAPTYDLGYLSRLLGNKVGSARITRASQTLAQWASDSSRRTALLALLAPTHVIIQLGANDVTNNTAFATIIGDLAKVVDACRNVGAQVYLQTYTTVTTSSDSWATIANQTVAASHARRVQVNGWMRNGGAETIGAQGYLEIADLVEPARNSGLWLADGTASKWTADGTHLTQFAHRFVASQLDLNMMGVYV